MEKLLIEYKRLKSKLEGEVGCEENISQLDEKEKLIMKTFSTSVKQEFIPYVVDVDNKTIGEQYSQVDNFKSVFCGFFE